MSKLRRLIYSLLLIPQIIIVGLLTIFCGLFVVPLAVLFGEQSKDWPKLFWLVGNDEEGYPEWFDRYVQKYWYKKIFPHWWWYAIRNPINNMRFIFEDRDDFHTYGWQPEQMEAQDLLDNKIRSAFRWRMRGPFFGFRKIWLNSNTTYSEVWFGWKVGSTVPGMGFATSYRRKREIGT